MFILIIELIENGVEELGWDDITTCCPSWWFSRIDDIGACCWDMTADVVVDEDDDDNNDVCVVIGIKVCWWCESVDIDSGVCECCLLLFRYNDEDDDGL